MELKDQSGHQGRARVLAAAGLAVALAGTGLFAAGAANAAVGTVTIANNAPAQVLNDGTAAAGTVVVTNSGDAISGDSAQIALTVPAGILCSNVVITATGLTITPTNPTANGGACNYTAPIPTLPSGSTTLDTTLKVTTTSAATTTGTITSKILVGTTNAQNVFTPIATSNTGTTNLVGPSATVFAASVPAATIYQAVNDKLITTAGLPADTTTTLYTSAVTETTDPTTGAVTLSYGALSPSVVTGNTSVELNDDLSLNAVTGVITRSAANSNFTDQFADDVYYLVSNNGNGGSASVTPVAGTGGGATPPTPTVNQHDVVSPLINIPTLFSDVAARGTFSNDIYTLADGSVITGNADGTFRPKNNVLRQEFATFAARLINNSGSGFIPTGPCGVDGVPASNFPDVPNFSQFCAQINGLANAGIVMGNTNGTFTPTAPILRQSIAAFIYRTNSYIKGLPAGDASCTTPVPFTDVSASNVFCGDIEFAAANKIANGTSATKYSPTANALREQTAAFVNRLATYEGITF